jgi:hypothetical protein
MTDRIRPGTMLIEDGTYTPESLVIDTEHYSAGWSSIMKSAGAELGKEIEDAGWTLFYMAGEIRGSGFGFNDQSRTARAVAHLINAVRRENCNCLEITQMRQRSFLGLRYTSLVAHARHIQKSRRFQELSNMPTGTRSAPPESLPDLTRQSETFFTDRGVEVWEDEGGSRAESNRPV